jgi:hypothetical protein
MAYIPSLEPMTAPANTAMNRSAIKSVVPIGAAKNLLKMRATMSVPPVEAFCVKVSAIPTAVMMSPKRTAMIRSSVYLGIGTILSKKSMKKLRRKVQYMVFTLKSLPTVMKPMTKSAAFMMYIQTPTGSPKSLFKTMARPLAPPAAMELGIRNETTPTAVMITPIVANTYSFTMYFLPTLSPPYRAHFTIELLVFERKWVHFGIYFRIIGYNMRY